MDTNFQMQACAFPRGLWIAVVSVGLRYDAIRMEFGGWAINLRDVLPCMERGRSSKAGDLAKSIVGKTRTILLALPPNTR